MTKIIDILTNHARSRIKERGISEEAKMKVTFDRKADASYIKLSNKEITKTASVSDYCNVDLDKEGRVIGVELLFISQYMDDFKLWLDIGNAAEYLDKSAMTCIIFTRSSRIRIIELIYVPPVRRDLCYSVLAAAQHSPE